MGIEERREYKRRWAAAHPDKVQQYRRDYLRRKALAELMQEGKLGDAQIVENRQEKTTSGENRRPAGGPSGK